MSIGILFEGKNQPPVRALYSFGPAILQDGVDIGAQPFLEKIAVALLETKLVVVNNEEPIHD